MKKIKNIAVTGWSGTGKSTIAKLLAEKLGWEYLSIGNFVRQWHKENNIPIDSPDLVPEQLDRRIDNEYKQKMIDGENMVLEGHLIGWLAKDIETTFNVLCICDYDELIRRISQRDSIDSKKAEEDLSKRSHILYEKFKKLYGVENVFDESYFDMIIDTTKLKPEQIIDQIMLRLGKG